MTIFYCFFINLSSQPNASLTRFAVKPLYLLLIFLFTTVTKKSASSADSPSSSCMNNVSLFVFDRLLSTPFVNKYYLFASCDNKVCSVPIGASFLLNGTSPCGNNHSILGSKAPFKTCLSGIES